jgi:hypothetical protein
MKSEDLLGSHLGFAMAARVSALLRTDAVWATPPPYPALGGEPVTLAGTGLAPRAMAEVRLHETPCGLSISLHVTGLAPCPSGTFYEAWLRSPDGDLVPVGTFHLRGGNETIQLWAGVDTDRYPTFTVTVQHEGAGTQPSGVVVLQGRLSSSR